MYFQLLKFVNDALFTECWNCFQGEFYFCMNLKWLQHLWDNFSLNGYFYNVL